MPVAELLLAEFDHEMASTRRMLERVPSEQGEWRPHAKSRSLRALAQHVATVPRMGRIILSTTEFDMATIEPTPPLNGVPELLASFDTTVKEVRALIVDKTDAELIAAWTFKNSGKTMFEMPKALALRRMFLNHLIHHRAQLGVYLRLNDVPLPPIYGPTADEKI